MRVEPSGATPRAFNPHLAKYFERRFDFWRNLLSTFLVLALRNLNGFRVTQFLFASGTPRGLIPNSPPKNGLACQHYSPFFQPTLCVWSDSSLGYWHIPQFSDSRLHTLAYRSVLLLHVGWPLNPCWGGITFWFPKPSPPEYPGRYKTRTTPGIS